MTEIVISASKGGNTQAREKMKTVSRNGRGLRRCCGAIVIARLSENVRGALKLSMKVQARRVAAGGRSVSMFLFREVNLSYVSVNHLPEAIINYIDKQDEHKYALELRMPPMCSKAANAYEPMELNGGQSRSAVAWKYEK